MNTASIPQTKSRRLSLAPLGAVLILLGGSNSQATVTSGFLRLQFEDGYGFLDYDSIGTPGLDPTPGTTLPAGYPVTAGNGINVLPNVYPASPYTYSQNTVSAGNGAIINLSFQPFGSPGLSNALAPSFVGSAALTLQQFGTVKIGPARLRLDWSIDYLNTTGFTLNLSAGTAISLNGTLFNPGDFIGTRYHQEYNVLTGGSGTSVFDNLAGGDPGFPPGFWYRSSPPTTTYSDSPMGVFGSSVSIAPGGTFREDGYLDVLVDPAFIQVNIAPEPSTGAITLVGGLLLAARKRLLKRIA